MKRTSFQYRRWFVIDATPAQFGGLVEGLNSLYATDEGQQFLLRLERPFHVYGPLSSSGQVVIVRYPGGGELDEAYRDPRYGWIDAIPRLDGKTDLVMTYNFDTPVLHVDTRILLWQMLFGWLEESGCPVVAESEEQTPAAGSASWDADTVSKIERLSNEGKRIPAIVVETGVAERTVVRIRSALAREGKIKRRND